MAMRANGTRRRLIGAALGSLVTTRLAAQARGGARIGYLELVKAADGERLYRDFVESMRSHGYVEGHNLTLQRRSAGGRNERLFPLAAELGAAKVDVILASTTEAAKAARLAAPDIPTIFVIADDPVLEGLVKAVARPAGNVTGVVTRGEDLTGKRLQLLKEAFPHIRTVAVLGSNVDMARLDVDRAAARLQLGVVRFPVNFGDDYRDAAAAIARSSADAVLVVVDADTLTDLGIFARMMMATRRPVMFNADVFVEAEGAGLMAYGVSLRERYRRAAELVSRVLKGTRPSDVPVEQPTRYELVVNLRTAEEYAIVVPREFLQRADRVIR